MEAIFVYITTSCSDESHKIGKILVEERLAACANIFPEIASIYQWDGKLCESKESVLILKTRSNLFQKVEAHVRSVHSYETPCIVALPIVSGSKEYIDWISKETKS